MAHVIARSTHSEGLADILERVLDKGLVIAGDIQIKLCDVELLTIRIRLLVASVDKAREMGLTWWWEEDKHTERQKQPHGLPSGQEPLTGPPHAARTPWERYMQFQQSQLQYENGTGTERPVRSQCHFQDSGQ